VQSVDVTDLHGDFVADGTFGGTIAWSRDETALIYVAEVAAEVKDATAKDAPATPVFEKYRYESDWGERMPQRTKTCLVLVRLNSHLASASIIPNLPLTVGQVCLRFTKPHGLGRFWTRW
jgi:hypothetical protein